MYMTFDLCIDIAKALADQTRLRIFALLEGMELSVKEITEVIGSGQSGMSRHLGILAGSGILECRKDGLWSFYVTAKNGGVREVVQPYLKVLLESDEVKIDRAKGHEMIARRTKKTLGYFNAVARDWNTHRYDILGGFDLDREILKYIGDDPVADIGCGNGTLAEMMLQKGLSVIGVDASPKMIDAARRRAQGSAMPGDFRIGECEHLPLRDNEVSTVLAVLVLHHLSDPERALSEFARVLKKEGKVIIADLDAHKSEKLRDDQHDLRLGLSKKELTAWLSHAGFSFCEDKQFKLANGLTLVVSIAIKQNIMVLPKVT
jgi:ArsR family transcriptional regulator